jgi:subtilisin family serine protease
MLGAIAALMVALSPAANADKPDAPGAGPQSPENQPQRIAIKFRRGMPTNERAALHRAHGHGLDRVIPQLDMHAVVVPPGKTAEEVIARYANHPLVEFAEEEVFMEPAATPNDPWFANWQIPLQLLSAEAAWDTATGSPDVPIAVLDTGLDYNHFEFSGRVISGYDFADSDSDYFDLLGHGTLVTGVIGAMPDNSVGMAGATWQNPIMVLRTAFGLDTVEAIAWATDHGARVISMSFGGHTPTSWEADALQYAFDRGVILVGAAGNEGTNLPTYPAAYPTVLAVTGVDSNGQPIGYNWGDWLDLSAPGGGVLTTFRPEDDSNGDGLGFVGGTSIATPFVAAAAGLVLSVNPSLSPTQVMEILRSTADDLGDPGFDVLTGHGRVNFQAAVLAAAGTEPDVDTTPPSAAVTAPVSGDVISGLITILVAASDDTRVAQVDLYCDGAFVSSDTVEPHEWAFDSASLPDGEHVFHAVAHDAAGNTGQSDPVYVVVDNSTPCDCPPDCSTPSATEVPGESCADGLDNDCDGTTDCEDADCLADDACADSTCNNDGVCDVGEDCDNCPLDCHPVPGASCGNRVCEAGNGEDCITCPADCNGKLGGKPSRRFCCGDAATACGDTRCEDRGLSCTVEPVDVSCCGDGVCEGNEDSCSCADDCGSAPPAESVGSTCGDGIDNDCDGLADCDDPDCTGDPVCPACDNDDVCEPGEDCVSCPNDCQGRTRGPRHRRFCCGNSVLEGAEGDGSICDGNP